MSSSKYCQISNVITRAINNEDIFGASYSLIGENENYFVYEGFQGQNADKIPLTPEMYYDLASVTKVVGTTTRIFQLIAAKKLALSDEIGKFLPDIASPELTIQQLLLHESGLPADFDNVHQMDQATLIKKVKSAKTFYKPGSKTLYSDLNYILLGWIIEKITGTDLATNLKMNIFLPLGMTNTGYKPQNIPPKQFVPTEYQADRGGIIRGQAHDYKAYLLNGVSGHAGLFSTLNDLTKFMRVLIQGGKRNDQQIFPKEFYQYLKDPAYRKNDRSLGWAIWDAQKNMFWHTGFTGTSLAFDLDKKTAFVCLTNRIYPTRNKKAWIKERREAVAEFFGEKEAVEK